MLNSVRRMLIKSSDGLDQVLRMKYDMLNTLKTDSQSALNHFERGHLEKKDCIRNLQEIYSVAVRIESLGCFYGGNIELGREITGMRLALANDTLFPCHVKEHITNCLIQGVLMENSPLKLKIAAFLRDVEGVIILEKRKLRAIQEGR